MHVIYSDGNVVEMDDRLKYYITSNSQDEEQLSKVITNNLGLYKALLCNNMSYCAICSINFINDNMFFRICSYKMNCRQ